MQMALNTPCMNTINAHKRPISAFPSLLGGRAHRQLHHKQSHSHGAEVRCRVFKELIHTFLSPNETPAPSRSSPGATKAGGRRDYLEARQVSLFQLFDGQEYRFNIPEYQRAYSWEIKQVHELMQDLLAAYNSNTEYFLGAIVTVRTDDGSLQVIDGQQRLTTLVLLLSYMLAWSRENGNGVLEARIRHMLYLEADPLDPTSKGRFRLKLRGGDDTFFARNMINSFLPLQYELRGVPAIATTQPAVGADAVGMPNEANSLNGGVGISPVAAANSTAGLGNAGAPVWMPMNQSGISNGIPSTASDYDDDDDDVDGPKPLENETWYRMYQNAGHIKRVLDEHVNNRGVALQPFLFHVLHNCHLVLMNARDVSASMRIFSTINSRGMDLTMVDKLKADLMEVLSNDECRRFAAAWSEMEDILGRPQFHAVFNYMKSLAVAIKPEVQHLSVLEYFSQQRRDARLAASTIRCALGYARILLQLRQCRFEVSRSRSPAPVSSVHQLLADDGTGGIVTTFDEGGPDSPVHTYGAIRGLERQARHMALFTDDAWLPATLEFFQTVDDIDFRTNFLQGAEILQLYCELCCDAAQAAARWQQVSQAVMRRDNINKSGRVTMPHIEGVDPHLQHIFTTLALTYHEKQAFKSKLNMRDLAMLVPARTIAHLLLRAEGAAVSTSPELDFTQLHVERIVPSNPPGGSMWRRIKLGSPELSTVPNPSSTLSSATLSAAMRSAMVHGSPPASSPEGSPGAYEREESSPVSSETGYVSSSVSSARGRERSIWSVLRDSPDTTSRVSSTSSSSSSSYASRGSTGGHGAGSSSSSGASYGSSRQASSGASYGSSRHSTAGLGFGQPGHNKPLRKRSPPANSSGIEVKYWYDVQRIKWTGRLGNLILVPTHPTVPPSAMANADFDIKAHYYRACGVESLLPEWSGSVASHGGQYAMHKFSFQECQKRHNDLVKRLGEVFKLDEDGVDLDFLIVEDDDWEPEESVY